MKWLIRKLAMLFTQHDVRIPAKKTVEVQLPEVPVPISVRDKMRAILRMAESQMGEKEIAGEQDNPKIVEYLKTTTYSKKHTVKDETPWCAAFINWVLIQCGHAGLNDAWAESWVNWGVESTGEEGDIVVLPRHVAVLKYKDSMWVYCVGGNQGNQVKVSRYLRASVKSYRRLAA